MSVGAGAQNYPLPYTFSTIAGTFGDYGDLDGTNAVAQFESPSGVAVDTNDNVYIVDSSASTVRKLAPKGTNWVVTTIAGTADATGINGGTNQAARFNQPAGIALFAGNFYVADTFNNAVRQLRPAGTNWVVTTVAGTCGSPGGARDGSNGVAQFYRPSGIAADGAGNLYVADTVNNAIRKIAPAGTNWVVTTIAGTAGILTGGSGDGTNGGAQFAHPVGIAADAAGNLFVADTGNSILREIVAQGTNWVTTTIAGVAGNSGYADGTNSDAQFFEPTGIAVDASDNLYLADSQNAVIRKVTPVGTNWVTTSLAGWINAATFSSDGTGTNAAFGTPTGIAVDGLGQLFVTDAGNNDVRAGVISAVPNPVISLTPPGSVTISWPGFGVLQTNANLSLPNWGNYGGAINSVNGTNSVTFPASAGNLFFRLTN